MFLSANDVYKNVAFQHGVLNIPAILSSLLPPTILNVSIGRWEGKDAESRSDSLKDSVWEFSNVGLAGTALHCRPTVLFTF